MKSPVVGLLLSLGYVAIVLPVLRKSKFGVFKWLLWAPSSLSLIVPFLAPDTTTAFTLTVTVLPLVWRAADIAFQRIPDDTIVYNRGWLWRFAFFLLPDTRSIAIPASARPTGAATLRTVAKAIAPLAALYVLHALFADFIEVAHPRLLGVLFWAVLVLLQVGGLYSVINAVLAYAVPSVTVSLAFDSPWKAQSPDEFWSKRWNGVFRNFAHRHVFKPLLQLGVRPSIAALVVYLVSGLMHEYVVAASVGLPVYFLQPGIAGQFILFFTLQAAVSSIPVLRRHRNLWSTPVTLLWIFLSGYGALTVLRNILYPAYHDTIPAIF